MADIVRLVCEGAAKSLDIRVLDALVVQRVQASVIIEPANGDKGLRGIRAYLEQARGAPVLSIEDRNYRPLGDALASWESGKSLVWTRHEIENYLLDPRVVHATFQRLAATTPAGDWSRNLPGTLAEVTTFLADLARPLLEHHAGQVLFTELVVDIGRPGQLRRPFFGVPAHPRSEWLTAFRDEFRRLCGAGRDLLATIARWEASIEDRLGKHCEQFLAPEFLTSGDYLHEMDGHQLFSALLVALRKLGAHRLAPATLEDELLRALTALYTQGPIYARDDFALLRARLQQASARAASSPT